MDLDVGAIEQISNNPGNIVYKCSLECVICDNRVKWNISNYEAHLKKHHTKAASCQLSENCEQSSGGNSSGISSEKSFIDNNNSVMNIAENSSTEDTIGTLVSLSATAQQKINEVLKIDSLKL